MEVRKQEKTEGCLEVRKQEITEGRSEICKRGSGAGWFCPGLFFMTMEEPQSVDSVFVFSGPQKFDV
ncbi:hypothetical protein D7X48_11435 [bacterium D16-50]|nr:hypothetical protein D7X48_11435 [bacterium D16-50]